MAVGNVINNWVQKLGEPAQVIGERVGELDRAPLQALKSLSVAYSHAAMATNKFGRTSLDSRVDIPPFGLNPDPSAAMASLRPTVGGTYYNPDKPDIHPSANNIFKLLMSRRRQNAARLVRLIQTNDAARGAFEGTAGGRVVNNQRGDGVIDVQRASARGMNSGQTGGAGPATGSNVSAMNVYDIMAAMDQAIEDQAAALGTYASSHGSAGKGSMGMLGPFGMQGYLAGTDGWAALGLGEQGALGTLGGSSGTFGGGGGVPGLTGNNSLDTQTLKLKRMIDKRDQMINLYNQVINKNNETAKTIIGNLRS